MKDSAIDTTGAVVGAGTGAAIGAKVGAAIGIAAAGTAVAGTVPIAIAVGLIGIPVGLFGAFVVKTVRKRLDERRQGPTGSSSSTGAGHGTRASRKRSQR